MKTSDLIIGNYIKLMFNHEDYETLQVTLNDLVSVDKKQAVYEPIPLTEEWLLKFGFKKDLENDLYLESTSTSFFVWQNNRVELLDNKNNICISHCEYVHQLQNLYFALTGEELILKRIG